MESFYSPTEAVRFCDAGRSPVRDRVTGDRICIPLSRMFSLLCEEKDEDGDLAAGIPSPFLRDVTRLDAFNSH